MASQRNRYRKDFMNLKIGGLYKIKQHSLHERVVGYKTAYPGGSIELLPSTPLIIVDRLTHEDLDRLYVCLIGDQIFEVEDRYIEDLDV